MHSEKEMCSAEWYYQASFCLHEFEILLPQEAEVITSSVFLLHWHIGLKDREYSCVLLGRVHCVQQLLSYLMASSCCSLGAGKRGWEMAQNLSVCRDVIERWHRAFCFAGISRRCKIQMGGWLDSTRAQHIWFTGIKLRCKTCLCPELIWCISGLGAWPLRSSG